MLGRRRRFPLGLLFGTDLVPEADGPGWTGRLAGGDDLEVLDAG